MIEVAIAGVGAHGPLGTTALQLAMCSRAGRLVPQALPQRDRRGLRIGGCPAIGIDPSLSGYDRLLALGAPPAWQAAAAADEALPLFLAVAESGRPDDDERLEGAVLADLAAIAALPLDLDASRVFRAGHAGGASCLEAALARLAEPSAPAAVLVGGIDSWLDPRVLAWLDQDERLHARDTNDGLVPAEGAAFALLHRRRDGMGVRVVAAASGREETVVRDEPNLASAMTELVHGLCARAAGPVDWVLNDVNGERARVREWTKVAVRALGAGVQQRLPETLGDLGAATGIVALALAHAHFQARSAPCARALVALHSDGPPRGAFLLEASSDEAS